MLHTKRRGMFGSRIKQKLVVATSAIVLVGTIAGFVALSSPPASAASCGDAETSIISCTAAKSGTPEANDSANNPVIAVLKFVMQVMMGAVGIAAVGALIYAGILYSAAGGESGQVQKAKTIIRDTVLGIVVFSGMILILNFVIPGGVFGQQGTTGGGTAAAPTTTTGDDTSGGTTFLAATYNILKTSELNDPKHPGTAWGSGNRDDAILGYLQTTDIVGIQEGRQDSVTWLTKKMDDYKRSSYQWAIQVFLKKSRFTLVKQGTKDAGDTKTLVWVKVTEKTSGKSLYFATIHLIVDDSAKQLSELKVILPYIKKNMSDAPVVFVGDMNANRGSAQDKLIQSYDFKDSYDIATTKTNITYRTTLNGYTNGTSGKIDTSSDHQIDHIYVLGKLSVSSIKVVDTKGSDHLPVEANIVIPGTVKSTGTGSGSGSGTGSGGGTSSPSISFSGVKNFRDVATLTPTIVKPNLLYRSAMLHDASDSDKTKLTTILKNGAIIDLRDAGKHTGSATKDVTIGDIPDVNYPIEAVSDANGYVKAFVKDAAGRKSLKNALTKIANTSGATLVHCTMGKDRTGWTIAMVMYILGASDAQVLQEYLESNDAGSDFTVQATWLTTALKAARQDGKRTIMDYIKSSSDGIGLSDTVIAKLKSKLGVTK